MTDRRPLIEENELFAKLVADAKRREPPPEALQGLHQKLAARPSFLASLATLRARRWGWTALAGIGCLAAVGVMIDRRPMTEPPSEVPSSLAATATATAPSPTPSVEAPAIPSVSIDDLPSSATTHGSRDVARDARTRLTPPPAPSSTTPRPSQAPAGNVRRELELIAVAREALTKGDARACLAAIDLHDREFPAGQFALEAKVMRIEAAFAAGDKNASSLAREYLAAHPSSPYEARIRSLLSSPEDR
ncbi:hypothetical protein AKJ09_05422 [Labilithrix luteola]|uniref:Outer membrane lipoprotein BamD-like domain-containing protein n=1 Tax=Labilithrix luteola TaxID=1391654 RepID=A0A0K1PZ14_9BACT|nr:hypothetical protein [Labilithrix luteola]AKU98758.1 hypothetical protein AKJ09_05422 [Labilithrix luteola]